MSFDNSPNETLERIREQIQNTEKLAAAAARLSDEMAVREFEGHDAAGRVTVRVNSSGRLLRIDFASVDQADASSLGAAVMEAYSEGMRLAAREVRALTEDCLGEDNPLTDRVLTPYRDFMGIDPQDDNGEGDPGLSSFTSPFNR